MKPRTVAGLALPIVVTLCLAAWVLAVRDSTLRSGGYCANATVVLAGLFGKAETPADVGLGPIPSPRALVASLGAVDLEPLTVKTPDPVRQAVFILTRDAPGDPERSLRAERRAERAVSLVLVDYLDRCRTA